MSDAINAAVEAAKAAVSRAVPATVVENTAVAPLAGRGRSLADAVESAGTSCDFYLQVQQTGIFIDKEYRSPFESLKVSLRLADMQPIYAIRYMVGTQTQYGRSLEAIVESRTGQPWMAFCDRAQKMDPKAAPYDAIEFVCTLREDVTTKKGVIPAGTTLGHTTSITNYRPFATWVREMMGQFSNTDTINVVLRHVYKDNGKNQWGWILPELATN